MSSSLSSIILIGVVWLLIVTTLFVRRHSPVRRTSKVLSETRVVHEGGTGITRTRRRPLPAESLYHSDPDSEIELVEAEPEQVVIDDTREPVVPSVVDGDVVVAYRALDDHDTGEFAPVSAGDRPDAPDATVSEDPEVDFAGAVGGGADTADTADAVDTVTVGRATVTVETTTVTATVTDTAAGDDGDDVTDRGFGHDTETTAEIDVVTDDAGDTDATDDTAVTGDADDADGVVGLTGAAVPRDIRTASPVAPVADLVPAGDARTAEEAAGETVEETAPRFTEVDEAYVRGGDIDVSVGTDDELPLVGAGSDGAGDPDGDDDGYAAGTGDGPSAGMSGVEGVEGEELTAEDLDFLASRKGRGIYDPVASRELADQRLRRRRRVLWALAAVTLLSLVGAVVVSRALWAVVVLAVALTAAYLYSLRKQTVAEQALQRRRLARMRRARLGVRSTDDRELGVPDRLRRPGAVVVETDDADPAFADLGYADVTFADYGDYVDHDDRTTGGYAGAAGAGDTPVYRDDRPDDGPLSVRVV